MVLWARRCCLAEAAHYLLHRNAHEEMGGWLNGVLAKLLNTLVSL